MVNCAQILTVDKSRLKMKLGKLDTKMMRKVEKAICINLDLSAVGSL